ncbi:hypothetical protein K1T71_000201 [Dendrolimus kikuchii]|uniref:Uncharacterized protein n=1 Tax=Dendrolimus kikuchii TaxID=765133 RepID=A0ACC1DJD4_9NEOP|nr:hypothetical protein K1T71_000201 [Dendrolimus kikuchii]
MEASASPKVDNNVNETCNFFFKIDNTAFLTPTKQNRTVIKYTKLPAYDLDSKVSWTQNSCTLQPRLRRIIGLDGDNVSTSRSLHFNLAIPANVITTGITKRKFVTISEDEEYDLHPRFRDDSKTSSLFKTSNRSVEANLKKEKQPAQRISSRLNNIPKSSKDPKQSAKMNNLFIKKDLNLWKTCSKTKSSNVTRLEQHENRNLRGQELNHNHNSKVSYLPSKVKTASNSKNSTTASKSEKEINITKHKVNEQAGKTNILTKKLSDKAYTNKISPHNKGKEIFFKDNHVDNKSVIVIHVPIDDNINKKKLKDVSLKKIQGITEDTIKIDSGTDMVKVKYLKDTCIGTEPPLKTIDQATEINQFDFKNICNCRNTEMQTEVFRDTFDSLDIPNVTLTKDKSEYKNELIHMQSKSLPNLQMPSLRITSDKEKNLSDISASVCKNTSSYIIRRSTVTYTTKQEINFQVVNSNTVSNHSPSPLSYPLNVMSVFKREIKNRDTKHIFDTGDTYKPKYKAELMNKKSLDELNSFNCSYTFNSNKLMKPSDIISTIRVNNGLLQNDNFCEQFQRELHFIDSFFESLQYLENSSLSNKRFPNSKMDKFVSNSTLFDTEFEERNSDYGHLLAKLENGANIDDTETMASKSLCLLNLLIQDEQRRAKNLLFVLKMREDALKDFTKSQILWLENKKKHDTNNTAISILKKKQRGALLKLQHECGEMQRMRKTLLALSEKRKIALMKTKKNIELRLKNDINVEQIILGKKKLKRNTMQTPERPVAPLKCFDLSSSGCEEYTTSRHNSDTCKQMPEVCVPLSYSTVKSAEKCIQTGDDSIIGSLLGETTDTAAENFVVVDGGYLNILFHNLSLPQIFSSGKQYEVNEEALKNIVTSSNSSCSDFNDTELVEKLMDQIKNRNLDRSSSPSTARSLIDEFDQYYKVFNDDEKSSVLANLDYNQSSVVYELKDTLVQANDSKHEQYRIEDQIIHKEETKPIPDNVYDANQLFECDYSLNTNDSNIENVEVVRNLLPTGPLPVPAGEAATSDCKPVDDPTWPLAKSSATSNSTDSCSFSSQLLCGSAPSSLLSMSSTVHSEAEELRRQQLAIEREIKVLEQQQCRLLIVREIPDKPPPPYTPPSDSRVPKPPRMFNADENINDKIHKVIVDPSNANIDPTDAFDIFIQDFCHESVEKQKLEQSDKPWDACNLLPQKSPFDNNKLVQKTSSQLLEVLTGVAPVVVSSVGTRRSDHIDDILFSEWRRCEPEWTNLQGDEAVVKNQVFESIFQKILTETIDEYKRIVHNSALSEKNN